MTKAVSKGLILGLAMLLASSALAATKGSLQIVDPVTVNGTQLKAGDYKVEWDGTSPNVEVSILKGKDVVTKVPAKVVNLQMAAANDAAVTQKNNDGTSSLIGVRFQGKKFALDLNSASDGMGGSSK